ncbi:MAG: BON domain-containing protein [Deltaproteobacteria bacterium]|nr:BON domain-containing protein [Deltaproteobacteria bacterium]
MDISEMKDEEILEAILEGFEEDARLNMNYIDVEVFDGSITISGRVSSEEELQVLDEVMTETLHVGEYNNKVWVDEALSYEDPDDTSPDLKEITMDDDDIDDQNYTDEDEEEEGYNN